MQRAAYLVRWDGVAEEARPSSRTAAKTVVALQEEHLLLLLDDDDDDAANNNNAGAGDGNDCCGGGRKNLLLDWCQCDRLLRLPLARVIPSPLCARIEKKRAYLAFVFRLQYVRSEVRDDLISDAVAFLITLRKTHVCTVLFPHRARYGKATTVVPIAYPLPWVEAFLNKLAVQVEGKTPEEVIYLVFRDLEAMGL